MKNSMPHTSEVAAPAADSKSIPENQLATLIWGDGNSMHTHIFTNGRMVQLLIF